MILERGCGVRTRGGVYAELGLSRFGMPIEHFLVCPPKPLDVKGLGLTAINLRLIERNDAFHVLDWVGVSGYPNPTDDIEEIRRFGMSAKLELPKAEDYLKLSSRSRILRVHPYAWIVDRRRYWEERIGMAELGYQWDYCPKGIREHVKGYKISYNEQMKKDANFQPPMCLGLLYEDVAMGRKAEDGMEREILREMPSFDYRAFHRPNDAEVDNYLPAVYLSLPIQRLVVVNDPIGKRHEEKIEKLRGSSLFDPETGIVEE